MSLTWEVDGSTLTNRVRWREWALVTAAERGVVGAGQIILDDATGSYIPPGQKDLVVTSIAGGSNLRIYSGFLADRTATMGKSGPGSRSWSVTVEDINARLDDRILTDAMNARRPKETDVERIDWLLSTGAMTGISRGGPGGAYVASSGGVDVDKIDYRGKTPREVLEDCAQASGRNFFLFDIGAGVRLFYHKWDSAQFTSDAAITDDSTLVDSVTTFGAYNISQTLDPRRVYSRVRVRYKGGAYTTANNATTASTYRTREIFRRYMRAKTATQAQALAEAWLDRASEEATTLSLTVDVPAASAYKIVAGQRISVTLARYGVSGYYRIVKRTMREVADTVYSLDLELHKKIQPTRFVGPAADNPDAEETSNGTDSTATVVLDEDGITVTGGKITISNGSGDVILDGSLDIFSIVATGTITIPRSEIRGVTKRSVTVTTGLAFDPAAMFFAKMPSKDGTGDWSQPLPEIAFAASGTVLRSVSGRARYASGAGTSAKTQIQVSRFSSSPPDGAVTVRYYILNRTSI